MKNKSLDRIDAFQTAVSREINALEAQLYDKDFDAYGEKFVLKTALARLEKYKYHIERWMPSQEDMYGKG